MILFKVIDWLFIGLRYGSWGLGVMGIILSFILMVANLGMGMGAVMLCIATLLISIALTLLLAPYQLFANKMSDQSKYIIAAICLVAALTAGGIVYFTNSGFPALNLLFL